MPTAYSLKGIRFMCRDTIPKCLTVHKKMIDKAALFMV